MCKKRTKILFVTGTYAVGGKERQLTELIFNLPEDRYEIHLFVKKIESYYFEKIRNKLASIYSLEKTRFSLFDIFSLLKYIRKIEPDIIHSWATLTSHFSAISKFAVPKHFVIVNGAIRDAPTNLSYLSKIEAFLYGFYNVVISNSTAGLRAYKQINKKNRYVVPNGYDLNRVSKNSKCESRLLLGWDKDAFIVTMVACLAKRKDHKTFIRAAKRCLEHYTDIVFIIVGDGDQKQDLIEMVGSTITGRSRNAIKFIGERSDIETLLNASDLSVLLSATWHGEGIPNAILESMACGTPVIASDNGGTSEVVLDGINGYLIACGDERNLADKIIFLKNNIVELRLFGLNAKNTIALDFTLEKMVDSYINIYTSLLNAPNDVR
jgi:glycosyltransferase involved in cell wall biosynthesis